MAYINCKGTAKVQNNETGEIFNITSDDLEWETEVEDERPMGAELHHSATFYFDGGEITWDLYEYPIGTIELVQKEIDGAVLLQDFNFSLNTEDPLEDSFVND
ncbi:hypothetical protein [Nostoc sp. WHI]|jgi:hypothetical protein|uniref:hypothetical protein n=1 Tax=Nostoc sp. WHI TaxID=2650611 RepID=UPI0018C5BB35|nr:hypothetical protein [Nostoc sp. WHI]MBG1266959.1 hypothetical protein [Nostoc sp. WHI]